MASFMNQTFVLARPQDAINQAATELDKFVNADNNYDDLSKRLRVYNEQSPNDSGLTDRDYPSLSDDKFSLPPLPELGLVKRVPLPNELVEQFSRMQCNCMMGIFPEINRAWLTIDSDVFVWNYENGGDLAYYDSLNETIIACGLVKPKAGTCSGIPYLLVITTPIDIYLLGVTFGDVNSQGQTGNPVTSDMNLLPAPLHALPSDNSHFLTVQGTSDGRIFIGARDGCLYEVLYQTEDNWFSKKCRKVNLTNSSVFSFLTPSFLRKDEEPIVQIEIDEGRKVLYTRSEPGSIQVYDLGPDGQGASLVADMSSSNISRSAAQILKTVDKSNFENIVHISSVTREESVHIQLVAVTASGVRLYFATRSFGDVVGRPSLLKLVHVRLPPGFSASTNTQRPSKVHMAHYKQGTLLMVSAQSDDVDLLWTISSDCFPFHSELMETQMNMEMNGHTWAMVEEPSESVIWRRDPGTTSVAKCNPPLVVTQHMEQLRRFVLLSAQGSYIMHKLRPVDQLRSLLTQNHGYDNHEVEAFFKMHKTDQACATCLILICSGLAIDNQVVDWATGAFFMYGGDPRYDFGIRPTTLGPNFSVIGPDMTLNPGLSFHPAQVSTPHPNSKFHALNSSVAPPAGAAGGGGQVVLSGKHDGIYLYLARILGPLWDSKLAGEVSVVGGKTPLIKSRVDEELGWFTEQLSNLLGFLNNSSQYIASLNVEGYIPNTRGAGVQGNVDEATRRKLFAEAVNKEKQSLKHLMVLVGRCLEILNLWKLACVHQFEVVCGTMKDTQKAILKACTLKSLLGGGNEEVFASMIDGIVQQYLGDNACTDAISTKLRDLCPSLYSLDDAKCSKANEILQSLSTVATDADKSARLSNALMLYKEVSPNLNLQQVCEALSAARYYEGILDICLTTASKRDPQNIALHYYKNGQQADDQTGYAMFSARLDCYNCVLDTLKFLLSTSYTSVSSPGVPNKPGPPTQKTQNILTADEAERHVESLYYQSIKAEDELFHVRLYEWMANNELTDKLLMVNSPYLEGYLKRSASDGSSELQLQSLEVLWRFYEKNKKYSSAAKILLVLADKPSADLDLQQRIEYLSRAVMSAKSDNFKVEKTTEGDLLHELKEKLDVAQVQVMVLDSLRRIQQTMKSGQIQNAILKLNSELMDVTTLYGSYADTFDLAECKLAILHCAGHYDSMLIETLWAAIIDKEFELTEGQSRENRMLVVQNKVICLAKKFGTNDKFFPLSFIIKDMEMRSLVNGFEDGWVINTMKLSQVPSLQLLRTYDKLYKAKDPCWRNNDRAYHLVMVVTVLLDNFLSQADTMSNSERSRFVTSAENLISGYLVELQSSAVNNAQTDTITRKLRNLQSRMQRGIR